MLILLLFSFIPTANANVYFEPELGIFAGGYRQESAATIFGLQGGFSAGYKVDQLQAGIEANFKSFETNISGEKLKITNFPIGLSLRYRIFENWRVFAAWYWDDVLYKDFRFNYSQEFKIPKDYDIAYEGPGSWRVGLSYLLSPNVFLNQSIFPQCFRTFKRKKPVELIGDLNSSIQVISYAVTVSVLF